MLLLLFVHTHYYHIIIGMTAVPSSNDAELIFQDEFAKKLENRQDASTVFFELANAPQIAYRLDRCSLATSTKQDNKNQKKKKETKTAQVLVRVKQNSQAQTHTGGVVWETSYLLLGYLLQQKQEQSLGRVLVEVGAGCGLLGIALAVAGRASQVIVTEVDLVMPLLQGNVQRNQPLLSTTTTTRLAAHTLDWTHYQRDAEAAGLPPHSVDTIVGTDVVFNPSLVEPLWQTLQYLSHARTVIYLCLQVRCATSHDILLTKAGQYGFHVQAIHELEKEKLPDWAEQMECFLFRITPKEQDQKQQQQQQQGKRKQHQTSTTKRSKQK